MTAAVGPSGSGRHPQRLPRRAEPLMVPKPFPDKPGLLLVDATWGQINPIELGPGVRTVGELELIAHFEAGRPLVDSRPEHAYLEQTIPGASNLPHGEIESRLDQLDPDVETVFFCNGPQCGASPEAIRSLLGRSYPAQSILYYRGGLHDWLTLGLPTAAPGWDGGVSAAPGSTSNR